MQPLGLPMSRPALRDAIGALLPSVSPAPPLVCSSIVQQLQFFGSSYGGPDPLRDPCAAWRSDYEMGAQAECDYDAAAATDAGDASTVVLVVVVGFGARSFLKSVEIEIGLVNRFYPKTQLSWLDYDYDSLSFTVRSAGANPVMGPRPDACNHEAHNQHDASRQRLLHQAPLEISYRLSDPLRSVASHPLFMCMYY